MLCKLVDASPTAARYLYQVRALNSAGNTASPTSAARTNDGSPLNLSLPEATSQPDLSTTICWQPPAVPKGAIVSYTLLVDNRVAYSGLALCTSLGVLQPDTSYSLVRKFFVYISQLRLIISL